MRAFIFSLDSFVAFTLALVAIYSLIFFSSVPSAYYYLLTQGHYLSRDILLSLSTTRCDDDVYNCKAAGSLLDNIVAHDDYNQRANLIKDTVGPMVPVQFGYIVELSDSEGTDWEVAYDTRDDPADSDQHNEEVRKITVATQVITFGYGGQIYKLGVSPYKYLSCGAGDGDGGAGGGAGGVSGGASDFGIITCGQVTNEVDSGNGTFTNVTSNIGNTHPSDILGGDLVPSADVRLVRLTIFI
jgi:hypothetical protein